MIINEKRCEDVLKQLFHEFGWLIGERNVLSKFADFETSSMFLRCADGAITSDMYTRIIRILDDHDDAKAFHYLYRCKKDVFDNSFKENGISYSEIQSLSQKFKTIRDKVHFHIDKQKIGQRGIVFKEQNIQISDFDKLIHALWNSLIAVNETMENKSPIPILYDGADVPKILTVINNTIE